MVIPPMNKTLIGMLVIGMLVAVPAALAVGGSVGGLMSAQADATASYGVDYSGAVAAADDTKMKAKETVDGAIGAAGDAAAQAEASAEANKDTAAQTSVEAKTTLLGGIEGNLQAFGGWISGLWVKPEADAPAASDHAAHIAKDLQTEVRPGYIGIDGVAHGDVTQDLTGGAGVEYNLPPPPQPKLSFATELKMAFESFLHFG